MQPLTGEDPAQIAEFRLMFRLGAGGMGRVYLARSGGGRFVALKTVHPWLADAPGFRERFALEIAASKQVSGAGTVAVVAADAAAATPWLASTYVPGPSLAEAVQRHGPLPEAAVWRLLSGLTEALGRVHSCRLVHRDLKPSNVLLSQDGPQLIDFGIVRAVDRTALTGTGLAVRSPGYMAPEQARGSEVGPAADVFALGAVLAYAATGQEAFGGGSGPDVLYRVVHQEPEIDGVPDELAAIVRQCLAKEPEERPTLALLRGLAAAHDTGGGDWLPGPVMSEIAARAVHLLNLEASGPPAATRVMPNAQGTAVLGTEPNARRLTAGAPVPWSDGAHRRGNRRVLRTALGAVLVVVLVAGIAVTLETLRGDGSSAAGAAPSPTPPVSTIEPTDYGTLMDRMAKTLDRLLPPGTGRVEVDPQGNSYSDSHAFVIIAGEHRFDVTLVLKTNRARPAPDDYSCDDTAPPTGEYQPPCASGVLPTGEKAIVVRMIGESNGRHVTDIPQLALWHDERDIELSIWPDTKAPNVVPVPLTDQQLLTMVGDSQFLSLTKKIPNKTDPD